MYIIFFYDIKQTELLLSFTYSSLCES